MKDISKPLALTTALLAVAICNPAGAEQSNAEPFIDGGRIVLPAATTEMVKSGGKRYDSSAKNFITRWISSYYGVNGTLDEDIADEGSIAPSCSGTPFGGVSGAPTAFTSGVAQSDGRAYTAYWHAPSDNMHVVKHFLTQVESATTRDVTMLVGADDGIRVWLNGDEVLRQDAPAVFSEGAHQIPVTLHQGWNLLMVKLYYPQLGPRNDPDHEYKYWSLRFAESDGVTPVLDVYQSVDGWCAPDESLYGWAWAPGAADASGALGSQWQSEFRITNPYNHNLFVRLGYYANSNRTGDPDGFRELRLDPFETVIYDNVVRELTGEPDSGSGMIALNGLYYYDVTALDAARVITSNVGSADGGSFGTQMPFGYRNAGRSCCSQQLFGLKNGPDNRTNLLVMPTPFATDEMVVTVNLWDPESGRTASAEFTGRGSFQINDLFNRVGMGGVTTSTAIAYVRYFSTASNAYWRIMASINDRVTSDPTFVERAPYGIPTPFQ